MDTLSNYEPVVLKVADVQKAVEIIRQQQIDNMRLTMHPMLPYGMKVFETTPIVHFDASA